MGRRDRTCRKLAECTACQPSSMWTTASSCFTNSTSPRSTARSGLPPMNAASFQDGRWPSCKTWSAGGFLNFVVEKKNRRRVGARRLLQRKAITLGDHDQFLHIDIERTDAPHGP